MLCWSFAVARFHYTTSETNQHIHNNKQPPATQTNTSTTTNNHKHHNNHNNHNTTTRVGYFGYGTASHSPS